MKVNILLSVIISFLLSYAEELKAAQTKWFTVDIPKDATINAHCDDIAIYAEIRNKSNNQILIEALPFKVSLQDAYSLIGRKYPTFMFSGHNSPEYFSYSRVNGLKAQLSDDNLRGEAYCFYQNGYTVYIFGYGRKGYYKSISQIVNSLNFIVPPYTKKQMEGVITQIKKALPYQVKSSLTKMMPKGYTCNDVILNVGNGYCQFKCILTGDFSFPHFPYSIQKTFPKVSMLVEAMKNPSIYTIDAPLLTTAYLLGSKMKFSFVKPDGRIIKLNN